MAHALTEQIKAIVRDQEAVQALVRDLAGAAPGAPPKTMKGGSGSLTAVILSILADSLGRMLLLVSRDRTAAEEARDDLGLFLGAAAVRMFGGTDHQGGVEAGRNVSDIQTLRAMEASPPLVLITHPQALLARLPRPAAVAAQSFTLDLGSDAGHAATVKKLNNLGFNQKDFVETYGDFAVRGGIVDIFPFVGENPVRLEFAGDTIDSIREFDPLSQRSIKELSIAVIVPDVMAALGSEPGDAAAAILDYVKPGALLVLDEPALVATGIQEAGIRMADAPRALAVQAALQAMPALHLQTLGGAGAADLGATLQPAFNGSIATLHRDLAALQEKSFQIIITCDSPSELSRLKDLLASIAAEPDADAEGQASSGPPLDLDRLQFSLDALHGGFILPSASLAVYTEHQIFNRIKRRGKKRHARFKGFTEKELRQLRKGDFVVHEDFGIGRFNGLKKIQVRGAEQEVVSVLYEEKDTLYVNLNYVKKLQKYSSKEGHVPRLTRLGSPEWDRLRARVKKRVKDIARDLISLYARRKHSTGFSFSKDTPWQKEMEASFMYEDTFDQARATLEVKQDMESPSPMDRLVCGDVGFGKTEVAVRAAFKSVLDGKQAAVLVPTTILAMQHFNTFVDRTSRYGVRVEALSRFKQKKEQEEIIARLKEGGIDIIIGTHRILSKDIVFKDLGLLVIDEEHRFGVAAKEKLRQMRATVDTLSMTATPIPRTLHFSLMGARDLSLIGTPPRNRLPVITEIAQWGDDLIRDAIMREIHRGGQVYFVHDRVDNIEVIAGRLRDLMPTVKFRIGHGQMQAHELEDVMMGFLERKFDVLVATKIIESGLDIPNVNTIVINRADRFGMAELYQLRGRVGRSNVQAYAYLLTPPVSSLPRATLQRLQAVEEFTELGSGFNLAMRDLEIRGAGNLLGSEQSGFIESMGFETYTRILEEAVQELKQEEFQNLFKDQPKSARPTRETMVEADFDAFIPDDYVRNDTERLAVYRRLYGLATEQQMQEVRDELRDRFGGFPPPLENLFAVVRIRLAAARLGFVRVNITPEQMEADFPPEEDADFYAAEEFQRLMTVISRMKSSGASLRQSGKTLKLIVNLRRHPDSPQPLAQVQELLSLLAPPVTEMKIN